MNCADVEILICDYVDGTLAPERKAELERHLAECPACAELAADSAAGAAFLERAPEVQPPPELITRILFQAPWRKRQSRFRAWLDTLLSPILQPRYAMSMAMTIVSFAMLARFVVPMHSIRAEDLKPAAVWAGLEDRAYRAWGRALQFYDNLKVVYQIQATLKEWQQRTEDQPAPAAPAARENTDDHKLPVHSLPQKNTEPGSGPIDHAPEKQN
jgi:Putative zinc-finger